MEMKMMDIFENAQKEETVYMIEQGDGFLKIPDIVINAFSCHVDLETIDMPEDPLFDLEPLPSIQKMEYLAYQ